MTLTCVFARRPHPAHPSTSTPYAPKFAPACGGSLVVRLKPPSGSRARNWFSSVFAASHGAPSGSRPIHGPGSKNGRHPCRRRPPRWVGWFRRLLAWCVRLVGLPRRPPRACWGIPAPGPVLRGLHAAAPRPHPHQPRGDFQRSSHPATSGDYAGFGEYANRGNPLTQFPRTPSPPHTSTPPHAQALDKPQTTCQCGSMAKHSDSWTPAKGTIPTPKPERLTPRERSERPPRADKKTRKSPK